MQVSLLASYLSLLIADPLGLVISFSMLYLGYLLFGLEPTPAED